MNMKKYKVKVEHTKENDEHIKFDEFITQRRPKVGEESRTLKTSDNIIIIVVEVTEINI